jgi:glycine/D-amino acid oxidase-like deaminating enzyme
MRRSVDVVVVGGGIMGCASAYELAKRGARVSLFEMGEIGSEQSGRNWGFVRQQGRDLRELPLMMAAIRLWPTLSDELGSETDWIESGGLALATDTQTASRYEAWIRRAGPFGTETRLISDEEIHSLVPGINGTWTAGMYTPSDGHADPIKTTHGFAEAAECRGAEVVVKERVRAIATRHGRVHGIVTDQGLVRTRVIVCTAGRWSRKLLRPLGIHLPMANVRETVALSTPATSKALPLPIWTNNLAVRQRVDRRLVISNGGIGEIDVGLDLIRLFPRFLPGYLENRTMFRVNVAQPLLRAFRARLHEQEIDADRVSERPRTEFVSQSLRSLRETLPATKNVTIEHMWAGTIDATPDGLPVIARIPRPMGLIVAAGFSGHGFGMAPAVGRIVADLALRGGTAADVSALDIRRFLGFHLVRPHSVL